VRPVLGEHHVFCAAVVRRLRRAVCPSDGQDTLCGACASERRSWDRVRAVLRYDRHSRHLVLGLKHGDRTHLAGRSGAGCTAPEAKSSPMPTFLCRCHCTGPGSFGVRYNQAAMPALAIRSAGGPEVAADWLVRRRRTPVQGRLGPTARARNVRGAFAIEAGRSVAGKRLVVIDDVMNDRGDRRGVRSCAKAGGRRVGRGFDAGARAADRGIITARWRPEAWQ